MKKQYQVTVLCADGKYKPVSTLVHYEEIDLSIPEQKKIIIGRGLEKICALHKWTKAKMVKLNYTQVKVREYDIEKIKLENAIRYEIIKQQKYASGEWKRPTPKNAEAQV